MNNILTQLGVGGIFAILLLREVFQFLSKKKNGHGSGFMPVDFWDRRIREIVTEVMEKYFQAELSVSHDILLNLREIRSGIEEMIKLQVVLNDRLQRPRD